MGQLHYPFPQGSPDARNLLEVPHGGDQCVRFKAAMEERNKRIIMSPYEFTSKTHSLSTEDLGKIFIHSFIH